MTVCSHAPWSRDSRPSQAHLRRLDAEPGDAERLVDMTREHLDEYHKLTKEEKNKLVKVLEEDRSSRKFGTRLTQRGRTRDLHDTCKDIQDLVRLLPMPI